MCKRAPAGRAPSRPATTRHARASGRRADTVSVPAERPLTRREAAVDVVLTILLLPASAVVAGVVTGLAFHGRPNLTVTVLIQALLSLAGVNALLDWRGRSWAEIGLRAPRVVDLGRGLLVLLAGYGSNAVLVGSVYLLAPRAVKAHLADLQSLAGNLTAGVPLAAVLALLLLVGVYEEVLARGLLLERSRRLFGGGAWLPVLFSAVLFGLGHFYQGLYGVVQTALLGAVFAAFTLRWGTLWPAIVAHSAVNMLSVVQLDKLHLPS